MPWHCLELGVVQLERVVSDPRLPYRWLFAGCKCECVECVCTTSSPLHTPYRAVPGARNITHDAIEPHDPIVIGGLDAEVECDADSQRCLIL